MVLIIQRILPSFVNFLMLIACSVTLLNCGGQKEKVITPFKRDELRLDIKGSSKLMKSQKSMESDNVNSSIEDSSGDLWFGTTGEGIYKYDGAEFIQFTESEGLPSLMIFCIFQSSDGTIWVGTENGLCVYNGETFDSIYVTSPVHSIRNRFCVFDIMEDSDGTLWFGTVEGVYTYDGQSYELFEVSDKGKGYLSEKHNTENMLEDTNGNIWFGSRINDGVFCYDGKTIVNFKLQEINGHKWAWPALQDKDGNIWFSNWGGAYRYDGETFKTFTKNDGLCSTTIMRIMEDHLGNIWFGGGEGLCRYDGQSITHFTTEDGLPRNGIWSIMEDKDKYIWIGTRNTGLCKYDGHSFTNYSE